MSMRFAFRTDASVQIGTGHVMRCLTLADELTRQGHECRFICREDEGHLGELISSKGYKLTLLPSNESSERDSPAAEPTNYADWLGAPWEQDAAQTLEVLAGFNADWLVVDHYALAAEWEQVVSKSVGQVMAIDDLANRAHECELLLDQNLGRSASDYDGLVPQSCTRLIGPGYALLRPEFAQLRERSLKRCVQPSLKRILISLGGVDRTNVTGQVLSALADANLPEDTHLDIIMGAAAPYLEAVREQASQLPFRATVNVNVQNMAERMCLADLSIGAAGGTSWERCCLGLPALLVILAENQIPGARALEASGAVVAFAGPEAMTDQFTEVLSRIAKPEFLTSMSEVAGKITDGTGATKLVQAMQLSVGIMQ